MMRAGCIVGVSIVVVLGTLRTLPAQEEPQAFVAYPCRFKPSEDVAQLLRPLLSANGANPTAQLVVDRERNRILLSGPAVAHQITRKLLREVDQSLTFRDNGVARDAQRMQSYRVPAVERDAFLANIAARLGNRVRTSVDEQSELVFVLADETGHKVIEELVRGWRDQEGSNASQAVAPRPLVNGAATSAAAPLTTHPRFIRIPIGMIDRIQQQFFTIFNGRLKVRSIQRREIYLLQPRPDTPQVVEVEFDRGRSGVLIGGEGKAANQLITLIDWLARPEQPGRRSKVFRLRRENHQKLNTIIDGASTVPTPSTTNNSAYSIHRLPTTSPNQGGVQWVRFLFQEDESTDAVQALGTDEGTPNVRQFEGVDIESLPDLDVIILRGPDSALDQLADVIRQLERISRETQPEVQIYTLRFAQSEAIVEMIEEIRSDLVGARQGRVTLQALVKPNAVLLIGWGDAVAATLELIKQLDQPVEPESQSQVFRIKHASAGDVLQTLQSFFANRGGLAPRIQLAVDARTNSLVAYAAPRDMAEITRLVSEIDRPDSAAVNRARVFPIRNALADDVAATLLQAIQAAGGDGERSAILELQTFDAKGQKILRSGTLRDIQITPNARNNTLIVSSPIENLDLLEELIRQLDTPASQAKIKVFRIINGNASSLIETLRSLIPSELSSGGSVGSQLSASGEAGLAPLRFSVDVRSNSIIATGSEGDLRIVEALLAKLDQSNLLQRQTAVYRLKNSPAIDVATAVNQYLFNRRQLDTAVPGQGNTFAEIEREVVVVPEPVANKLILAATPRYFKEIEALIEKLDEAPPQVLIQVLIAEVALNNADEFGIELGIQDSVLFDRSLLGDLITTTQTSQNSTPAGIVTVTEEIIQAATNIPGFAFNSIQPLGNSGSATALQGAGHVGGQGISNFAVGRGNDQLGFGGLVLSASSRNVNVLLRALRESRRVDVLSRPQIRTLDNQPAFIQVGQRVPRISGSTVNQNGQTNQVELENVGLILGVTPRISPDGNVVMEIDAEKSALGPEQEGIPVAVSIDGTVVRSPRVDTTTAQATVSAADGETIVLGGLITKSSRYVYRSVPVLGDIPIIERLFRFDSTISRRTELLIILTPHVIRTAEDNERIRQTEMAQMSWCACDVFNLMGDMNYTEVSTSEALERGEPEVIYPAENPLGSAVPMEPPVPLERNQLSIPEVLLDGPVVESN